MTTLENLVDSSEKLSEETKKTIVQPPLSSLESSHIMQIAALNLELAESGSFKICCPPSQAKQTTDVLKRLSTREQELWSRRFSVSCLENITSAPELDPNTKRFYDDIAKKLREQ